MQIEIRTVRDALFAIETRGHIIKHLTHVIDETATGREDDPREALNEIGFLLMALEEQIESLQEAIEAAEDAEMSRAKGEQTEN